LRWLVGRPTTAASPVLANGTDERVAPNVEPQPSRMAGLALLVLRALPVSATLAARGNGSPASPG
jgi:hypothetical protein